MKAGIIFSMAILSGAFLFAGSSCSREDQPPIQPVDVYLKHSDPNAPIYTRVGEEFTITLPSHKEAGYAWVLSHSLDNYTIEFVDSTYYPPTNEVIGRGGKEEWRFLAKAPGDTTIQYFFAQGVDPKGMGHTLTFNVKIGG